MEFIFLEDTVENSKYFFRISPGDTPFYAGTWALTKEGHSKELKDNEDFYVSPALYCWIKHYFDNEDNNVFAIERPKNFDPLTIASGANSLYHYVYTKKSKNDLKFITKCILNKDYDNKRFNDLHEELEKKVKSKFNKSLSQMKGGEYLGTLEEWDENPVKNGYPEVILPVKTLKKCKWEKLNYLSKNKFIGSKSKKVFKLEFDYE